jgi:diguanylate cyclase (GGDEF)-like protein/PAS domain S-box-containing protein
MIEPAADSLFRSLIDALPDGVVIVDDFRVAFANPAAVRMAGAQAAEDLIGEPIDRFVDPRSTAAVAALTQAFVAGSNRSGVLTIDFQRIDGRALVAELSAVRVAELPSRAVLVVIKDVTERERLSRELAHAEARQRMILDGLQEGVVLHTVGSTEFLANPVARDVLGLDGDRATPFELSSLVDSFLEPDGAAMDPRDSPLARAHRTRTPQLRRQLQFVRQGDERRWLEFDAIPMDDLDARAAVLLTFRDVTKERTAQDRLAESAQLLASVMTAATNEAIIITDNQGIVVAFSRGAEDRFGYPAADVVGVLSVADLHDADELATYAASQGISVTELILRPPPQGGITNIESRMRRADGSTFAASINVSSRIDDAGLPLGLLYVLHDITQRLQLEADLLDRVARDHLTGLWNRRALETRLEVMATEECWSSPGRILMFIDLDHFKEVNDAAGHQVGDIVLAQAAERIAACVRSTDSVFRYGGDEFVVVFDPSVNSPVALRIAQRIVEHLATPFIFDGGVSTIGASVGIACSTSTATPDQLVYEADAAVYAAKRAGRGRVVCMD